MSELNFIVLTGRFAAGKDTQASLLVQKIGSTSEIISTGDIYRSAKAQEGEYARYHHHLAPFIEDVDIRGKLLPDSVITQIVQEVITEKIRVGKEIFLFTGFPRTVWQLRYFDGMVSNFRISNCLNKEFKVRGLFIEYKIGDEITLERSRKRRDEYEKRGEIPRPWDSDEGVTKRISTYYRDIEPMIEKLRGEGRLITIDGTGSIESIHELTIRFIETPRFSKERE
jgi:adenylate kinase family enzyme